MTDDATATVDKQYQASRGLATGLRIGQRLFSDQLLLGSDVFVSKDHTYRFGDQSGTL
jgi:hypothetical protein